MSDGGNRASRSARACAPTASFAIRLAVLASCGAAAHAAVEDPPWAAPALERAVAVWDSRTGESISFAAMLDELAQADAVFLGETHIDECTHRVEFAVYDGLLSRRNGAVVLAMEMFERDVQSVLDDYLAGRIDEPTFVQNARAWSNYATAYRPLVERAREKGRPVVASNFPRPLIQRVAMEGLKVLDGLEGAERRQAPAEILPNSQAYWRRTDNAIRGHLAMMRAMEEGDDQRLGSTQTLWDNSMGESVALALAAHPGSSVVHVNGGFHSAYHDGTVAQFRKRNAEAKVLTVAIDPAVHPAVVDPFGVPEADFLVYAESRARDFNDGAYSVDVTRSAEYLLRVPDAAKRGEEVPFLLYLCEDGLRAEDGMTLCRALFGDDVMIAVLEPLHRETQPDLGEGGRWYFVDDFSEDVSTARGALERCYAYVSRHFPVDHSHVVLVGEGTGATVAVAEALFTETLDVHVVARAPSRFAKLKDFSLPLPELRGEEPQRRKSLSVLVPATDREWWEGELGEYRDVGLGAKLSVADEDPFTADRSFENEVRAALGRPAWTGGENAPRRHLSWDGESVRARHWMRLLAVRASTDRSARVSVLTGTAPADSAAISLDVRAANLKSPGVLPPCPGPFGGTTVLVVPANSPELDALVALEENDPLAAHGRFHRLRVATLDDGERGLASVLAKLKSQNRSNVLVVPAEFCAGPDTMRAIERSVRPFADTMTLQFQPGLGAAAVSAD